MGKVYDKILGAFVVIVFITLVGYVYAGITANNNILSVVGNFSLTGGNVLTNLVLDNDGNNSPNLTFTGNSGGVDVLASMQVIGGSDPYMRFKVTNSTSGAALISVFDLHDSVIAFATDNTVDVGAAADNRPKNIYAATGIYQAANRVLTQGGGIPYSNLSLSAGDIPAAITTGTAWTQSDNSTIKVMLANGITLAPQNITGTAVVLGSNQQVTIAGENVSSGTVADARLESVLDKDVAAPNFVQSPLVNSSGDVVLTPASGQNVVISADCAGNCAAGAIGYNTTHFCVCASTNSWLSAALA